MIALSVRNRQANMHRTRAHRSLAGACRDPTVDKITISIKAKASDPKDPDVLVGEAVIPVSVLSGLKTGMLSMKLTRLVGEEHAEGVPAGSERCAAGDARGG